MPRTLKLAIPLVLIGVVFFIWLRVAPKPVPIIAKVPGSPEVTTSYSDKRTVYPYSVVPGGVLDSHEVDSAQIDPVIAKHYAGIKVEHLTAVKLKETEYRYVSFRKDGKIYWTGRPIAIKAGEYVLTDGESVLRGRCGNRVSEVPMQPTLPPTLEPPPSVLDTPEPVPTPTKGIPPEIARNAEPPLPIPSRTQPPDVVPQPPIVQPPPPGVGQPPDIFGPMFPPIFFPPGKNPPPGNPITPVFPVEPLPPIFPVGPPIYPPVGPPVYPPIFPPPIYPPPEPCLYYFCGPFPPPGCLNFETCNPVGPPPPICVNNTCFPPPPPPGCTFDCSPPPPGCTFDCSPPPPPPGCTFDCSPPPVCTDCGPPPPPPNITPEPSSIWLLGTSLLLLIIFRKRLLKKMASDKVN